MNNKTNLMFGIAALVLSSFSTNAATEQHGAFKADSSVQVWNSEKSTWVTPEQFWQDFTTSKGGLTWSKNRDYPVYSDVNEHDTFLVELDSGVCLMEFFHGRWRRANDVQRWDDKFNAYGGCEKVFE
jgi:hypothetical protein